MAYIIVILLSVAVSWLTTKIVTIKYFDVIDGYTKGITDEVLRIVEETVGAKESEKRRYVKSNFCEKDEETQIRYSK